jgi:hypothetical protein
MNGNMSVLIELIKVCVCQPGMGSHVGQNLLPYIDGLHIKGSKGG